MAVTRDPLYFKPGAPIAGRSAIEVWEGPTHVATIYTGIETLNVVCEPGAYLPVLQIATAQTQAMLTFARLH